jgi:hypothetical protein
MGVLDYPAIEALIDNHTARTVDLSPSSIVLLLAALQQIEGSFNWRDGLQTLNATDWDIAENWIAKANQELMIEAEQGTDVKTALLYHTETSGDDGGSLTLNTWNLRKINLLGSDPDSVVLSLSSDRVTLVAGDYTFNAHAASRNAGRNVLSLYDYTTSNRFAVGMVAEDSNKAVCISRHTFTQETVVQVEHWASASAAWGRGAPVDTGKPEVYLILEISLHE